MIQDDPAQEFVFSYKANNEKASTTSSQDTLVLFLIKVWQLKNISK